MSPPFPPTREFVDSRVTFRHLARQSETQFEVGGGQCNGRGGGGTALWNMLILKETVSRKMCRIALGRKMILPSKSYDYIEYNISSHLYCIKIVSILVGATERQHTGPVSVTPTLHIAASQPLALLPTGTQFLGSCVISGKGKQAPVC